MVPIKAILDLLHVTDRLAQRFDNLYKEILRVCFP